MNSLNVLATLNEHLLPGSANYFSTLQHTAPTTTDNLARRKIPGGANMSIAGNVDSRLPSDTHAGHGFNLTFHSGNNLKVHATVLDVIIILFEQESQDDEIISNILPNHEYQGFLTLIYRACNNLHFDIPAKEVENQETGVFIPIVAQTNLRLKLIIRYNDCIRKENH